MPGFLESLFSEKFFFFNSTIALLLEFCSENEAFAQIYSVRVILLPRCYTIFALQSSNLDSTSRFMSTHSKMIFVHMLSLLILTQLL